MIVVADASPLCYLVAIGESHILRELFGQVLVPHVVIAESLHEQAPNAVRVWASNLPSWVSVMDVPLGELAGMEKLHPGEQGAILLAQSTRSNLILLDEKSARRVATGRGLQVTGTLGLLREAASRGLVELSPAIDRLRKTNFRYSPALLKSILDRSANR